MSPSRRRHRIAGRKAVPPNTPFPGCNSPCRGRWGSSYGRPPGAPSLPRLRILPRPAIGAGVVNPRVRGTGGTNSPPSQHGRRLFFENVDGYAGSAGRGDSLVPSLTPPQAGRKAVPPNTPGRGGWGSSVFRVQFARAGDGWGSSYGRPPGAPSLPWLRILPRPAIGAGVVNPRVRGAGGTNSPPSQHGRRLFFENVDGYAGSAGRGDSLVPSSTPPQAGRKAVPPNTPCSGCSSPGRGGWGSSYGRLRGAPSLPRLRSLPRPAVGAGVVNPRVRNLPSVAVGHGGSERGRLKDAPPALLRVSQEGFWP